MLYKKEKLSTASRGILLFRPPAANNPFHLFYFFLCLFFLRRFFLLCVAILCRFLFLPQGIVLIF